VLACAAVEGAAVALAANQKTNSHRYSRDISQNEFITSRVGSGLRRWRQI
jgi:hypothetical protein